VTYVDLNCDLGEGMGDDAAVLPFISSASVACGLHAGGPRVMRQTVEEARRFKVAVGAHPSYADRAGFGRREMNLPPQEVHDLVLYQIGALEAFARTMSTRIQHVKPHGALYHAAAHSAETAEAIAAATRAARGDLIVVGVPGSCAEEAARRYGLRFAAEVFADRNYGEDGQLLPRSHPQALVAGDDQSVAARAVAMIREQSVFTLAGMAIAQPAHTICLHGDDPRAVRRVRAVRAALEAAGIAVAPLGSWL
jgi:5-oxoprolinase (ATP-hydrolysing) subunit A